MRGTYIHNDSIIGPIVYIFCVFPSKRCQKIKCVAGIRLLKYPPIYYLVIMSTFVAKRRLRLRAVSIVINEVSDSKVPYFPSILFRVQDTISYLKNPTIF